LKGWRRRWDRGGDGPDPCTPAANGECARHTETRLVLAGEDAFFSAAVDTIIPADQRRLRHVHCVTFIDRQLAAPGREQRCTAQAVLKARRAGAQLP
jgi:hypothetical protein